MSEALPVAVIGAGVSGLSCGVRLQEYGFKVTILAKELHPETTSSVAAAIWYPYKALPLGRVLHWSRVTLEELYRLSTEARAGVSLIDIVEVFDHPVEVPWWKDAVMKFRRAAPTDLPKGYSDGYIAEVPLMDTTIYMPYLSERFQDGGGTIRKQTVSSPAELFEQTPIVVNCSGLGSRDLVGDKSMYPIRGQVVTTNAPRQKRSLVDIEGPRGLTYIIPRDGDCILGGTDEEHSWNLGVDAKENLEIVNKCSALDPSYANAPVVDAKVGLRPGRAEVRLESEDVGPGRILIHNYGHGGSGFTGSWGCADEVMNLAIKHSQTL